MKNILLISLSVVAISTSCKKQTFEHKATSPESCPKCEQTAALQNTYRGRVSGPATYEYYVSPTYQLYYDSMTVSVTHIFLGQGAFLDSNNMVLRFAMKFDHNPDTIFEVQPLNADNSFSFKHNQNTKYDNSFISSDSLVIDRDDLNGSGGTTPFYVFKGVKI